MPVFSCGRSLYIDWRIGGGGRGNVLHHVKRDGELSDRGNVWGNMSHGKMSRANVLHWQPIAITTDGTAVRLRWVIPGGDFQD